MCLTPEALAFFLTILGPSLISGDDQTITVHATAGDVRWHLVVNTWCTGAPDATPAAFWARIDPLRNPPAGR
ncbi:MAG: hypothetical protein AAFQ19_05345 [Pseudomonadota bacterium]